VPKPTPLRAVRHGVAPVVQSGDEFAPVVAASNGGYLSEPATTRGILLMVLMPAIISLVSFALIRLF